jgi:hypothetical protein
MHVCVADHFTLQRNIRDNGYVTHCSRSVASHRHELDSLNCVVDLKCIIPISISISISITASFFFTSHLLHHSNSTSDTRISINMVISFKMAVTPHISGGNTITIIIIGILMNCFVL